MKAYLAELVRAAPTPAHGRNVAREYLQARILGALQRAGAMIPLAFHGGTALRFLYASPRYSEDLDFALERAEEQYDFRVYLRAIRAEFEAEGYIVTLKVSDQKAVHSAFVRFPGLPYELGLSPHRNEVLAVKIEVDTNPPAGAGLATTVIRRHVMLQLQHHDRASLFAGKLHALLQRPYTKGRDLYDLLWYLSDPDWPPPNLTLLNNALQQTGWTGPHLTGENWRLVLRDRLQRLNWDRVVDDVRPLLEPGANPDLLTLDNVMRTVEGST
ncbi:MAG TPA: nucleotidyl transferase AbiEii/AbiGii toxin family protein [Anaerolineae bacterium]|nr:nucleotidyl transferase AbiEii/AbiGii toxin family protein [Anaerolineae bacterium]